MDSRRDAETQREEGLFCARVSVGVRLSLLWLFANGWYPFRLKAVLGMGYNYRLFGIWDDVWLEVVGDLRIEELRVESKVEEGTI